MPSRTTTQWYTGRIKRFMSPYASKFLWSVIIVTASSPEARVHLGAGGSVQFHRTSPTESNDFVLPIPEKLLIHTSENASGLSHVPSSLEKPAQCTLNSTLSPTVFRATVLNIIPDLENRNFAAMCIDLFRFHSVFGIQYFTNFLVDE